MRFRTVRWWVASSLAILMVAALFASFSHLSTAHAADGLLEPGKAFRFDARVADATHVEVGFEIAPGYYMYREQFKFAARGATLGEAGLPAGHVKFDETFQKNVETYRGHLAIPLPVEKSSGSFTVSVVSQGCSDRGVCYPPSESHVEVRLTSADGGPGSVRLMPTTPYIPGSQAGSGASGLSALGAPGSSASSLDIARSLNADSEAVSSQASSMPAQLNTASPADSGRIGDSIRNALQSGRVLSVIGVFLVAGVLLSLTPCVLPMVPILSSIIVGDRARGSRDGASEGTSKGAVRARSFGLAVSYSLGMAVVYTALGVAAGLAGEGLAAALQKPWVLGVFALSLAALALSMFGVYELKLPSSWCGTVTAASGRMKGGRAFGVFVMGGLSALIVSPCVAAPLAGALVYISQTRDALLGGAALFSLAVGMSVPLLLIGASAGTLLPRAGPWMDGVKRFFGMLLLAVALWIVQPVLPAALVLAMWGALLVFGAVGLGLLDRSTRVLQRSGAVLLAIFGLMQLVGAASGGADPLQPLSHLARSGASPSNDGSSASLAGGSAGVSASSAPAFRKVRSSAELDQILRTAKQPVMLDFYADWCVSCKEMERFTFTDASVRAKLSGALLLKADVTRNSPEDRELLRRFNLFGPPGTLFFDNRGNEIAASRVIGFESPERFNETLSSIGL